MKSLQSTFWARANLAVWFLVVILLIIALQDNLSEAIRVGRIVPENWRGVFALALTNRIWTIVKLLALVPVIIFWLLDHRRGLRLALVTSLGLLTIELLASVMFLVLGLTEDTSRRAAGLVRDTLIVAFINLLVFSLWYWLFDAEPLQRDANVTRPNEFLFPQDGNPTPKYANWQPAYMDYLFVAFTTSTAFGPTDTLPLTRRAKALMMLQALLSLIIIIVLASRALSVLR